MELTRLIYTVLENKGQHNSNSKNNTIQEEENSMEKKNMYNMLSSQISDLLKINRFSNENHSNKINEELNSIKNELEGKKGEIT